LIAADVEQKTRSFVGRTAQMDALAKYLDSNQHVPLLVTGDAGSGKSALLANLVKHQRDSGPVSLNVVYHFVGASPMSTNPRHMLWRTFSVLCVSIFGPSLLS
jgi:Cdc6-like AAA superfamily ATPase